MATYWLIANGTVKHGGFNVNDGLCCLQENHLMVIPMVNNGWNDYHNAIGGLSSRDDGEKGGLELWLNLWLYLLAIITVANDGYKDWSFYHNTIFKGNIEGKWEV